MKILFKSINLFFLGLYTDFYKRCFDNAVDSAVKKGKSLSDAHLTKMSNKSWSLYQKFKNNESELNHAMSHT